MLRLHCAYPACGEFRILGQETCELHLGQTSLAWSSASKPAAVKTETPAVATTTEESFDQIDAEAMEKADQIVAGAIERLVTAATETEAKAEEICEKFLGTVAEGLALALDAAEVVLGPTKKTLGSMTDAEFNASFGLPEDTKWASFHLGEPDLDTVDQVVEPFFGGRGPWFPLGGKSGII